MEFNSNEPSNRRKFGVYHTVRRQLIQLGVSFQQYQDLDSLTKLLVISAEQAFRAKGLVKDTTIVIPESSGLSRRGKAKITTGKVNLIEGVAHISLKFGESRAFSFNALTVLEDAVIDT